MLEVARQFATQFGYAHKVEFVQSEYPDFEPDEKYDAIRLGVYGNYERVSVDALRRAHGMLNAGGLVMIGITPPQGLWRSFRNRFSRTDVVMSPARFESIVDESQSFDIKLASRERRRITYILQARSATE